jgi:hypothetical protein
MSGSLCNWKVKCNHCSRKNDHGKPGLAAGSSSLQSELGRKSPLERILSITRHVGAGELSKSASDSFDS